MKYARLNPEFFKNHADADWYKEEINIVEVWETFGDYSYTKSNPGVFGGIGNAIENQYLEFLSDEDAKSALEEIGRVWSAE